MARCKGEPAHQPPNPKESRAFCEGLAHATRGGLIGDNPHLPGSVNADNWVRGFSAYNGGIGTGIRICCADLVYDGIIEEGFYVLENKGGGFRLESDTDLTQLLQQEYAA